MEQGYHAFVPQHAGAAAGILPPPPGPGRDARRTGVPAAGRGDERGLSALPCKADGSMVASAAGNWPMYESVAA